MIIKTTVKITIYFRFCKKRDDKELPMEEAVSCKTDVEIAVKSKDQEEYIKKGHK